MNDPGGAGPWRSPAPGVAMSEMIGTGRVVFSARLMTAIFRMKPFNPGFV